MDKQSPVVVLVHGAFAGPASWNGVVRNLLARSVDVVAVANPLRALAEDAAYLCDLIAGIGRPVVLAGHSYGGMVITEAAAGNDAVTGLVYVCAFAPDHAESAFELAGRFPGSTLAEALAGYPVRTRLALIAGLPADVPAWRTLSSWFVFGDEDLTIPIALHRYMSRRAGARGIREVAGGSHALSVSNPDVVTASCLDALHA